MADGRNVLVHCRHGVHRTGSFAVLLMALLLLSQKCEMSVVCSASVESGVWIRCLQVACVFYERQRELQRRTAQLGVRRGRAPRDLSAEMKDAVLDFWRNLPADLLTQWMQAWTSRGMARQRLLSTLRVMQSMESEMEPQDDASAPAALPDFDAPLDEDESGDASAAPVAHVASAASGASPAAPHVRYRQAGDAGLP